MAIRKQAIFKLFALLLLGEAILLLATSVVSLVMKENQIFKAFIVPFVLCMMGCIFCMFFYRKISLGESRIKRQLGFRLLVSCWFLLIIISAIPYMICGYGFVDSWFESVSGWTTTGATVLDMTNEPRTLLFFRAITSWSGGLLIVGLIVTVFPALSMKDQWLSGQESIESSDGTIATRLMETIKIALLMYSAITLLCIVLLLPSDVNFFYSILNAFMAVSTSGIIDPAAAGAGIEINAYAKIIITVIAVLSSINYMVYYNLARKKLSSVKHNFETRIYLCIILVVGIIMGITLSVRGCYDNFFLALGNGFMQTISYSSTSGYVLGNIASWPSICKVLMFILMLIGGCSFSSASGLKVSRIIVNFKMIVYGIYKRIHPYAYKTITVNKRTLSSQKMSSLSAYVLMFFAVFILGSILISIEDKGLELTFTSVASAMTNSGTNFAMTDGNYAIFSGFGRFVSSILMCIGRLEIYPIMMMFSRSFWNTSRTK